MSSTVGVNGKKLSHKGSGGMARSTLPDVCKTPSPGGPVPIPYPVIISRSSNLKGGTKRVKADGKMIAVKGSQYASCSGDEAGTAKGVKSNTNMKEATWILFSFDVMIEGKNVCRHGDKMQMNHGNTVCLAGNREGRQKKGTPGNNRAQNKQFRAAIKEAERKLKKKLTKDQVREVHDQISRQNCSYHEIVDIAVSMFR